MPYIYILQCGDGSYYVGSTWNLDLRVAQHAPGNGAKYTAARLPITLMFAQEYERMDDAYAMEKRIQGWSRRKREALIRGDYGALPGLSERQTRRNGPERPENPAG